LNDTTKSKGELGSFPWLANQKSKDKQQGMLARCPTKKRKGEVVKKIGETDGSFAQRICQNKKESAKQRGGLVVPASRECWNDTTKKQRRANANGTVHLLGLFTQLFHQAKCWQKKVRTNNRECRQLFLQSACGLVSLKNEKEKQQKREGKLMVPLLHESTKTKKEAEGRTGHSCLQGVSLPIERHNKKQRRANADAPAKHW